MSRQSIQFADFHPAQPLCAQIDGEARTIHARTLGDCLADLVEAIAPHHALPEVETDNFRRCLTDARNAGMGVRYHAAWDSMHNRWVLTLHVRSAGNRYRVAKAVLALVFEQFCLLENVLRISHVPKARNA